MGIISGPDGPTVIICSEGFPWVLAATVIVIAGAILLLLRKRRNK